MRRANSLEKTLMLGKIEGRKEKGTMEGKMFGWHHWFNGHEFEQALGDGEGQGSLACCSLGVAESQTRLNNNRYDHSNKADILFQKQVPSHCILYRQGRILDDDRG